MIYYSNMVNKDKWQEQVEREEEPQHPRLHAREQGVPADQHPQRPRHSRGRSHDPLRGHSSQCADRHHGIRSPRDRRRYPPYERA